MIRHSEEQFDFVAGQLQEMIESVHGSFVYGTAEQWNALRSLEEAQVRVRSAQVWLRRHQARYGD